MASAGSPTFRVRIYSAPWRLLAATLTFLGGASVPLIVAAVLLASDPPITPPVLWRMFAVLTLGPTALAWLIRRGAGAVAEVQTQRLILRRRGLRVEVPAEAIVAILPWRIPLPGVGFWLRLRSGRRFKYAVAADDAGGLLHALAESSGVAAATYAARHPMLTYANTRRSAAARRWYHSVLKFPIFALLPTLILFNAHQFIAYGGTLGQYYLEGMGPYLASFAEHWITVVIYLVLWAALCRGGSEALAIGAALIAPARARTMRRIVEIVCRIAYYGGVPVLLGLRFIG